MAGRVIPCAGSRLVDILADMLRTALAWEEEHDCPAAENDDGLANALTPISLRIHCSPSLDESKLGHNPPMME